MPSPKLYQQLARYYDLIYWQKDYRGESQRVTELVRKYKRANGRALLDAACGTGAHLVYLKKHFACMGIDVHQGMLEVAKRRVHGVQFIRADMIRLDLGRQFDIITCLFSAIGYATTVAHLQKTIRNFARHLTPGGVLLIEPWLTPRTFSAGRPHLRTYDGKDLKIARTTMTYQRGNQSILDFHYLVVEKNKDTLSIHDRHTMGLFDIARMLKLLRAEGLRVNFLARGLTAHRGIFVAMKPM